MKRRMLLKAIKKLNKRGILFPNGLNKTLRIGDFELCINELDSGGTSYLSHSSYKEISNKLYELINNEYKPKIFVDIGANYGFTSIIASSKFKNAKIIAVEPSKKLIPYIKSNYELNDIKDFEIINAICGEFANEKLSFSISPSTSQDNRVIGENKKWKRQTVSVTNINSLLKGLRADEGVFIKIDTQGYEEKVFKGGRQFLSEHKNWIIKAEFAPYWLKSQGTNPINFLSYLATQYEVAELTETLPFFRNSIADIFRNRIQKDRINEFNEYVENLNKNQTGWIDLLIRPKQN